MPVEVWKSVFDRVVDLIKPSLTGPHDIDGSDRICPIIS